VIDVERPSDPVVRAFVAAVNAGDREAFFALVAPGATMSHDGSERNLAEWVGREIFSSQGRMEVESESGDGRSLVVIYTNPTFGARCAPLGSSSSKTTSSAVSRVARPDLLLESIAEWPGAAPSRAGR
jgi:hypothetical protein